MDCDQILYVLVLVIAGRIQFWSVSGECNPTLHEFRIRLSAFSKGENEGKRETGSVVAKENARNQKFLPETPYDIVDI
jgi:hypothetical protein